jgi:hypothetical protein
MRTERTERLSIGLVLVLAALLRGWGLGFGAPFLSNFYVRPDESLIVQAAAGFFAHRGHPGFFAYPSLLVECCAVVYALLLKPWTDFASNPTAYFLAARAISLAAGTLTVLLVYRMARRLCPRGWALAAAAAYAVSPLAVREAHFGVTDTLMTSLVAACLLQAMRCREAPESGRRRAVLAAAAWFGLALATKYTAALAAPGLLWVILRGNAFAVSRRLLAEMALAAATAGAVFVVLNPYVFLAHGESSGTVVSILSAFYRGAAGASPWDAARAAEMLLRPLFYGPGSWAGLVAAAAAVVGVVRRRPGCGGAAVVLLGTAPLVGALIPFRHPVPFRYLLPALPGVAVLAAWTAARLAARLANLKAAQRLLYGAVAVLLAWQLAGAGALVAALAREDTRTLAGRWIERNVPREAPVVLLGPPESEPQVRESAASIQRRIAYVYRLYGPSSGRIVSELYRLLLAGAGAGQGREVFRNPSDVEAPAGLVAVVTPSYPLPMIGDAHDDALARGARVVARATFDPFLGSGGAAACFDPIDAFFLPMNPWGRVARPGPKLAIVVLDRGPRLPATTGR